MRSESTLLHPHNDRQRASLLNGLRVSLASVAALGTLAVSAPVAQAAAQLDHSFGVEGVAFESGSPSKQISPAREVALVDKRLVALGNSPSVDHEYLVLGGFSLDGVLDISFGKGGLVYSVDFRRKYPIGYGMDLVASKTGKLLTTGPVNPAGTFSNDSRMCSFVARQFSDGALDRRFAFNGRNMICVHRDWSKRRTGLDSRAISLTRDGKIVIAGTSHHRGARTGAFVARLSGGGKKLDRSFKGTKMNRLDRAGMVEILLPEGQANFTDVEALASGKVLAAGTLKGRFLAARFLRNGRRDPAFGRKGVSSFDLDGQFGCKCSAAVAMARDRHGRILLAGYTMKYGLGDADLQPTVIRLKRNGRLDRSFGVNGVTRPQLSEYLELPDGRPVRRFLTTGLTLQSDGKIVISGEYNFRYSLLRLKPNGKPDASFFDAGVYVDWVRGRYGAAWDVITDRKGRIVSSGGTSDGGFVLMRMLP